MRQPENKTEADRPIAADGELEIGAVGHALWRKKWWVIAPTLIVAALAFGAVNMLTPRYKSEARILIDGRENVFLRPEAEKMGDRDRAVVDQEAVTSQVQLALSRDLARQVIRQLKLAEQPEFDPVLRPTSPLVDALRLMGLAKDPLRMTPEERVLDAYYERLAVYPVDKSRVIAVEFQSADPELAAAVANAVAEGYLAMQQASRQDQTRAAGKWLSGEIDDLRKKVADAEAKVEGFRARSNLLVGTNNTTLSNQQLGELNSQLAAARTQKSDAESKARFIRELLRSGQLLESAEFLNSDLIRRLSEQLVTLRAQLAEQSSTLLDGHPRIKELKAQIADLQRQIRAEAERLVRALENDARIASARVDMLTSNLDQAKRQAATTNEQDVELRALEREAKAQRDLLESYLAKYRETSARESLNTMPNEVRVISRAVVSNTPYFPKKLPIVLIATLATLVIMSGLVTTGELLAGSVYRPSAPAHEPVMEMAAAGDGAPVIGQGRWRLAGAPPDAGTVVAGEPAAPTAQPAAGSDVIANIAAGLRAAGEAGRRIAILGAEPKVGATLTALALARHLAGAKGAREARVVLVDLSFTAPSLAAAATDPSGPGIADLVRGMVPFGQIITRDRFSGVHLVPAGGVGNDGAAILASERLTIAIDALARSYDHVVLDAGADGALDRLARLAPQAVLVAPASQEAAASAMRDALTGAGFADVTLFLAEPAQPEAGSSTRRAA